MPRLSGVSSSVLINIREDTPAAPASAAEPRPPLSRGQAAAICWCRRYRAAAKVLTIVAQAHTPYTELITAIPEIAAAERVTTSVDAHRPKLTWLSAGVDMVIGRQRCRHRPTLMSHDNRNRSIMTETHDHLHAPPHWRGKPTARDIIALPSAVLSPTPTSLCPALGPTAVATTRRRGKIKAPAAGTSPDWSHVLITIKPY